MYTPHVIYKSGANWKTKPVCFDRYNLVAISIVIDSTGNWIFQCYPFSHITCTYVKQSSQVPLIVFMLWINKAQLLTLCQTAVELHSAASSKLKPNCNQFYLPHKRFIIDIIHKITTLAAGTSSHVPFAPIQISAVLAIHRCRSCRTRRSILGSIDNILELILDKSLHRHIRFFWKTKPFEWTFLRLSYRISKQLCHCRMADVFHLFTRSRCMIGEVATTLSSYGDHMTMIGTISFSEDLHKQG